MGPHTVLWATCAFLIGLPESVAALPLFTTISAPAFAQKLPGPDGFLGTADDIAAPGVNLSGTGSYAEFLNVAPAAGTNFHSFVSGTFLIQEPLVLIGGQVTVTNFAISTINEQTNGFSSVGMDLANAPHQLIYQFPGAIDAQYTLETCLTTAPAFCLEADLQLTGFTLVRGVDPNLIPGITPLVASYLNLVASLAPANWTAITITSNPPTPIDANNTRGTLASFFLGGTASGVTLLATTDPINVVPEPHLPLLLGLGCLSALAWVRRKARIGHRDLAAAPQPDWTLNSEPVDRDSRRV